MATTTGTDFERESRQLVEEFLRRDLLAPEVARRTERLYAEGETTEALEVIIAERRRQDAGIGHRFSG
jgi:hypothetical protein